MAKTPMIFVQREPSAAEASYTVPAGKHAIVNFHGVGTVRLNSDTYVSLAFGGGAAMAVQGFVAPSGTVIKMTGAAGSVGCTASGFLYDN